MAFITRLLLVFPRQREARLSIMVKDRAPIELGPALGAVTILTAIQIHFFGLSVVAPMTTLTIRRTVEKAISTRLRSLGTMALSTGDFLMTTGQWPARLSMIKIQTIQRRNIKITATMFTVALMTLRCGCVSAVIASSALYSTGNLLVAI
jgi:hypothetical protein